MNQKSDHNPPFAFSLSYCSLEVLLFCAALQPTLVTSAEPYEYLYSIGFPYLSYVLVGEVYFEGLSFIEI